MLLPRRRAAPLALAALLAAACRPAPVTPASPTAARAVRVLYAGSLTNLMETGLGPAFDQHTGIAFLGQGAGSVALANAIKDRTKSADLFISADPAVNRALTGAANGDWLSWYLVFARTSLVIGFHPSSAFAPDFERARDGALPWYQLLQEPGLRLGRTDPDLDPKGYRTLFLLDLAQELYRQPALKRAVLGPDRNPEQIFPEETLETRLETGALDAGVFYLNEAAEKHLPYLTLPDEINQSNPELAAAYARATYTNAKGQTFTGSPILYTVAILNRADDPAAALAFVQHLLSPAGQALLREHGLLPAPLLAGGDRAAVPAPLQPLVQGDYTG